jgi:hypothetical protein
MEYLGSGGYGLVIVCKNKIFTEDKNLVLKLFYNINDCIALKEEIKLQNLCRKLVLECNEKNKNDKRYIPINVPKIIKTSVGNLLDFQPTIFEIDGVKYLCGILMERITPPKIDGFEEDFPNEAIHLCFSNDKSVKNESWICSNGITRGFYANTQMIELILEEMNEKYWGDNSYTLTPENITYSLGKVYRYLIDNGIKPFDVEIILGEKLDKNINMIDFGKVETANIDPEKYYYDTSYKGLVQDLYVPHKTRNDKYWQDFYEGYGFEASL